MTPVKKVEFAEPEDEEEIILSEDEEEIDLEDEDLEEEDEDDDDEDMDMMTAFAGILRGTFHLQPDNEEDDEEDGKNICEVLADISEGMESIGKNMETQNKILLKILTQISNKK